MRLDDIKAGTRVRTTQLGNTLGMTIHPKHLTCRTSGISGVLKYAVPGHGGDVWFVTHVDGAVAAYVYTELELENS